MGLLLVGSISEVGTCSKVNQGERKCLHHRTTTVGRFKVSEMNGKGRLIVSKIGEYSHLTMPSQIFDEKTRRNHLEISVHKQKKKKKPSPCLLPLSPIHLFLLFYSLTAQALFRRANYGTGPLSSPVAASLLVTTRASTQVVGDVKFGVFPCVFIPLRHGPFADLTAFHSVFVAATSLPSARLSASLSMDPL